MAANRHAAKLTPQCVAEIKRDIAQGFTHSEIAEWHGCSKQTVSNIGTGHTWSEIKPVEYANWRPIPRLRKEVKVLNPRRFYGNSQPRYGR